MFGIWDLIFEVLILVVLIVCKRIIGWFIVYVKCYVNGEVI